MEKKKIYKLWWQGLDNAPSMVKICHESLQRNIDFSTQKLILLDQCNIFNYVDLPGYIMDKFNKGIISKTHLSDIIRSMILKESGGIWTDATMFYTKPIENDIFNMDFFTMKNPIAHPKDITSKWECFFIGGKAGFLLFDLLVDFWLDYWSKEDELITYLLTDHIFYTAYMENKRVKEAIDKCPEFYYRIDYFQQFLNRQYNEKYYQEIIGNEPYNKMTYKLPVNEKTSDGKITYYGKLVEEYLS